MKYFLLNGTFSETKPQGKDFKDALDAHHQYWAPFVNDGTVLLGGPKTHGSGLLIIKVESEEKANELAQNDPFVTHGVQTYEVSEFNLFMSNDCVKAWFDKA